MRIIKATYDGSRFLADEALPLEPGTRVILTVHVEDPETEEVDADTALRVSPATAKSGEPRTKSFADAVRRLKIRGTPDWSERVDYYMGQDMSGYSDNPNLDERKI